MGDRALLVVNAAGTWVESLSFTVQGPLQVFYRVALDGVLTDPQPFSFNCYLGTRTIFDPSGRMLLTPVDIIYPVAKAGICNGAYTFDPATGTFAPASIVAPEWSLVGLEYIGFDPTGTHFYATLRLHPDTYDASSEVLVFDVDAANGKLTLHSRGAMVAGSNAVAAGEFLFVQNWPLIYVYRIDPLTQQITDTGQRVATDNGWGVAMQRTQLPEPWWPPHLS